MRQYCLHAAAALALGGALACGGGGQTEAPQTPPPDAKRVDEATAGRISGRVTVEGPVPNLPPINTASDPVCARQHKDGLSADTFAVDNGGLNNVFVYVKDGLGGYYFETPVQAATLDQQGCRYVPHVFGVRTGQPIEIVNSDPTLHNVNAVATVNRGFNFGQPIQGMKSTAKFTQPEVMVRFKCDVHGWMSAYAGVLEHPYFAVSANGGAFAIDRVPPGTYTIEAWHERLGTQTATVTLGEKDSQEIAFTFKVPASTD
jgi:plastocyanin